MIKWPVNQGHQQHDGEEQQSVCSISDSIRDRVNWTVLPKVVLQYEHLDRN